MYTRHTESLLRGFRCLLALLDGAGETLPNRLVHLRETFREHLHRKIQATARRTLSATSATFSVAVFWETAEAWKAREDDATAERAEVESAVRSIDIVVVVEAM